jgi:hypothetical protein
MAITIRETGRRFIHAADEGTLPCEKGPVTRVDMGRCVASTGRARLSMDRTALRDQEVRQNSTFPLDRRPRLAAGKEATP